MFSLSQRTNNFQLEARTLRFAAVVIAITVCFGSAANAQWLKDGKNELPSPIVDSEPFDLLFLNENGDDAILKVKPFGDKLPSFPLESRGVVVFELFADFDEKLEVPNRSVLKIETFHDLLLAEARAWVSDGKYRTAFRNLLYLYDNQGDVDAELVETMRKCMFFDATDNLKRKDFERALSTYEDIYLSDPDIDLPGTDKKLIDIIMICYDGIIRQRFDAGRYSTVQKNVAALASKYPNEAESLVATWKKRFLKRSDELLEQARDYANKNEGRLAHQFARKADQVVPDRKEVLDYQTELLNQFPLVMVGVSQSAADFDPTRIDHWGSRRTGRLVRRRMVELSGLTDEGGQYNFLNGTLLRSDEVGLKYTFEIDNDPKFGVPSIDAFELSSRLINRGQPDSANFNAGWAKVVDRVFVEDDTKVSFTLKTPFVRPESLLTMPYVDMGQEVDANAGREEFDGHYVLANRDRDITTFETNPKYDSIVGDGHPVIIEQRYSSASAAVDDLMAGNIDVVDRISIGDIKRLKADPRIGVRPYALPTVHLLVPKIRSQELAQDLFFRTGLSHLIDRDLIVNEVICGGSEIDGCSPISGPFPIGTENNDQIAYGYDLDAKPIPYNEALGRVLTELAMAPKPPKRSERIKPPSMTIVYPPSSMAANACNAIARNWTQAGFPTETRVLKEGQSVPDDPNWDFLYVEVTMEEPLTDAHKLVGNRGIAKDVSAPIEQTLRILNYSRSWQSSCAALRRLHRQIRVDLSVIPLWQITEHYAFRNTARNLGRELVHLYQNVERWKIDPSANEEQKD
jgi:hypothetical protein